VRTHADLCVLMPETTMLELGWPLGEKAQAEVDDKKRKASKEIRVDAMRDAVEFSQRTSARGRGKVVLVFPAEQMNAITANALLKTLEEPPGEVKFVLASEAAHQLLPTIRSRCLGHNMVWPSAQQSMAWLQSQGISASDAASFLKAAAGRPDDAHALAASGCDPKAWAALPKAMAQGDVAFVKDWTAPQLLDALYKLCHDLMALRVGGMPRFFDAAQLVSSASLPTLSAWSKALGAHMRTMDHPFNLGLMQESLVGQAQTALNSGY
jgi:DNA polymerase-3 subunit delta'